MTKEQLENDIADAEDGEADSSRERSTIQFPYNDLNDAVAIAKAVHENAGLQCTIDQLAAYVKQSITSGAFRVRLSTAATFGLTENERGSIRLTDLGRQAADPSQETAARAEAFLHVPLYLQLFEHYKGYTLPPAGALEKYMKEIGVSSKQAGRARQAFMRSARQAGFFAHGEDRLVRPAGPGTRPVEAPGMEIKAEKEKLHFFGGGGGEGGDRFGLDPLLIELLKKVPPPAEGWPGPQRVRWFRTFAMNVSQIYDGDGEPVEMKIDLQKDEAAK